jgi:hypothetical protein
MKDARRRIDVNLEELDRVLDGARQAPLSESDHGKLKEALHALAAMLVRPRNTEKTSSVLEKPEALQLEHSRITTRLRPLDTAAKGQKHLVVHGRWIRAYSPAGSCRSARTGRSRCTSLVVCMRARTSPTC